MRIFKLNVDVDNYESCYIEETNISEDIFDNFCTATPLSFRNETVHFKYSGKVEKIGDVLNCWDFCGYLINDKTCNLLSSNNKIQAQYIKFQKDFTLLNNTLVIDGLNSKKTKYEYFENDIIGVECYSFKQLDYPPLFQIALPNGYVPIFYFVTDEFIDIVKKNNIKGFKFEEIWDSEKD